MVKSQYGVVTRLSTCDKEKKTSDDDDEEEGKQKCWRTRDRVRK